MELRPSSHGDIDGLARLVTGEESQPTTVAGMGLFGLERFEDALELSRVMIESTRGWQAMTVADANQAVGLIQLGEAFLAITPEIVEFAQRVYGADFQQILGPRLAVLEKVQTEYPDGCLQISEIHVSPDHRGEGIGTALMNHAVEVASNNEEYGVMGLQMLTDNPARDAFEAWGFEVVDTRTDSEFQELTGAAGYHLMLRELQGASPTRP